MATAAAAAAGCTGEGCGARDPWPLHHVRYRGAFRRLCTSCVLRSQPGAFCCSCFDILPQPLPNAEPGAVHCARCPAAAHLACLPSPDSPFVCPACAADAATDFSYFSLELDADGRRRIDAGAARALLAAARLAAASMSRAAAAARADAERKVREAAVARKRAREMLEQAFIASKRERQRQGMASPMVVQPLQVQQPLKKKTSAPVVGAQKRGVQSREREKWMRFHEPVAMLPAPVTQGVHDKEPSKNASVVTTIDVNDRVGALSKAMNNVGQKEEEKKGTLMGSQAVSVKEEEQGLPTDANLGPRIPQPAQDASVSRSNTRVISIGSLNTASLHS